MIETRADHIALPAENLRGKRRFAEAGRVLLEYGRDIDAACQSYIDGSEFKEALRIVSTVFVAGFDCPLKILFGRRRCTTGEIWSRHQ